MLEIQKKFKEALKAYHKKNSEHALDLLEEIHESLRKETYSSVGQLTNIELMELHYYLTELKKEKLLDVEVSYSKRIKYQKDILDKKFGHLAWVKFYSDDRRLEGEIASHFPSDIKEKIKAQRNEIEAIIIPKKETRENQGINNTINSNYTNDIPLPLKKRKLKQFSKDTKESNTKENDLTLHSSETPVSASTAKLSSIAVSAREKFKENVSFISFLKKQPAKKPKGSGPQNQYSAVKNRPGRP